MWSLLGTAGDGLVWDEPIITATPEIFSFCVAPPGDIRFVRVRHTNTQPIQRSIPIFCQMENVLMTICDVPRRLQRLEMAGGNLFTGFGLNGDRFDPMKRILQYESDPFRFEGHYQFMWDQRI